ncbi:hypothetical protein MY4824_010015 [Beauveria thailandica]
MPPDRVLSLFPERPIRPLPKRKLREKLSPEAIQTIEYPSVTVHSIPLFHYPTIAARGPPHDLLKAFEEPKKPSSGLPDTLESSGSNGCEPLAISSASEIQLQQSPQGDTKSHGPLGHGAFSVQAIPAVSSTNGYELLENPNNKKKRKIPSASDSFLRGSLFTSNGSVEILGLGGRIDDGKQATAPTFAVSGSLPMHSDEISGPGRGRLGRTVQTRSPLRTLSDGNNTWPSKPLKTGLHHSVNGHRTGGIISTAMADAKRIAPFGQENTGSLLQHHLNVGKAIPIASQFTFTCGSQVMGKALWPDTSPATSGSAECALPKQLDLEKNRPAVTALDDKATGEGQRITNNPRQLEKDLMLAAHNRRQAAVKANHHNPPRLEDVWICEFCEYERIFGGPPKALIREYEMKDRRVRQEEVDRRRLLEKAKAKSRKGKKGDKATKGTQSVTQSPNQVPEDRVVTVAPSMGRGHSPSTQAETGYEEKFDDHRSRDPPDILGSHEKSSVSKIVPIV